MSWEIQHCVPSCFPSLGKQEVSLYIEKRKNNFRLYKQTGYFVLSPIIKFIIFSKSFLFFIIFGGIDQKMSKCFETCV